MLQRVEPEVREVGGFWVAEDPEHAALFAELVEHRLRPLRRGQTPSRPLEARARSALAPDRASASATRFVDHASPVDRQPQTVAAGRRPITAAGTPARRGRSTSRACSGSDRHDDPRRRLAEERRGMSSNPAVDSTAADVGVHAQRRYSKQHSASATASPPSATVVRRTNEPVGAAAARSCCSARSRDQIERRRHARASGRDGLQELAAAELATALAEQDDDVAAPAG